MGAAFGLVIVLGSIILGSHGFLAFFSLEGLLIVVGGVIAVAFMSYEEADVRRALLSIKTMLKEPEDSSDDLHQDMRNFVDLARVIREKDLRAVEQSLGRGEMRDPFIKYGLNMVVSDYAPEDIRAMMETAADATFERESVPGDVLDAMTSHAPAFGMVGTLVGMVAMLSRLDDNNIATIGASLSVAFLSTLYGVLSARMVYMPAAVKLRQEITQRRFRAQLIIEGMVMLAHKKQPMFIQDRLNSFLTADSRDYYNVFKGRASAPKLKVMPL